MRKNNITKVLAVLLAIIICIQVQPLNLYAADDLTPELGAIAEPGEEESSMITTVIEAVYEESADNTMEYSIGSLSVGDPAPDSETVIVDGHTYTYTVEDDTAMITGFTSGGSTTVVIPDTIEGKTVTEIGAGVFSGKNLTDVSIPGNVTAIGSEAFSWNQLASVTIPDSVVSIGSKAFEYNHDTLTSITLGSDLESIGDHAFFNDKLESVIIPDGVRTIGNYAFSGGANMIASVTLGSGLVTIGESAFNSQKIESLTIPENVESIGNYCFAFNKLTEVTIYNDELAIGTLAFNGQIGVPNLTIYGYDPSSAKDYAEEREHNFIALDGGEGDTVSEPVILIQDYPLTYGSPGEREYIGVEAVLPDGITVEDVTITLHYTIVDTEESEEEPYVTSSEREMSYDEEEGMYYASLQMPWSGYVYYGLSACYNNGEEDVCTYLPELLGDEDYDYQDLYEAEVYFVEVHPEEVNVTPGTLNLNVNGSRGLVTARVLPAEAEDKTVEWCSTDGSVAVYENGMVVPVGEGNCQIIARANDGGIEGYCDVSVGPETDSSYMKLLSYSLEEDTTYVSIAYNNGTYIAVTNNGQIFKSTDLETFDLVYGEEYSCIYEEVRYINDRFIAVGYTIDELGHVTGQVSLSADNGSTWEGSTAFSKELFDIIYTEEGKYVAIGRYKQYVSEDAETWEEQDLPLAAAGWEWICKKLIYADGKYYAMGNDQVHPVVFVSEDCINWTQMELPEAFQGESIVSFNDAVAVDGVIIAGGSKGYMARSNDGETWTQLSIAGIEDNISVLDLSYNDGKYVLIGNGWDDDQVYMFESADGENWSPISVEGMLQIASVIPMTSGHVGVGEYSSVYKLYTPSGNPPEEEESDNNNLSNLIISDIVLSPAFASGTLAYSSNAANNIISVNIIPVLSDASASVNVNGQPLSDGSRSVAVSVGANTIEIVVTSESGIPKTYTVTITRAAAGSQRHAETSRDDDRNTASQPPVTRDNNTTITLNGSEQNNAAAIATQKASSGQTITTVTIDEKKLGEMLGALPDPTASNGSGTQNQPKLSVPVLEKADVVVGQLSGQMVKDMENKSVVLEIKTETASYSVPAQQIDISAVSQNLGQNVTLSEIEVQIEIAKPTNEVVKVVEDSANKGSFTLVVPPVEFNITCTYGNRIVEVSQFNNYVERTVAIPEGVDPSKITTGVVIGIDGTVRHVPTKIITIDGKFYAQINSLTNSTYSVIWNPIEFKDVANHWAKEAINDMGSRMIIGGIGNDMFDPDKDITRAEFAAIIVRALGLKPGEGNTAFTDVKSTDWYSSYIATAAEYKLITGYGDGKFGPMDKITHEQAMTIIARAMKLVGLKVELATGEMDELLEGYPGANEASSYAKQSIADCIKLGVLTDRNDNMAAPKFNVTRAEVAVLIRKLLQKSNLI